MTTQRFLYVFFATANWSRRRKIGIRRRLRIARRFPRRTHLAFLSWMVRVLSRSQLAHCSIGYDGAVLDPGIHGNKYWPFEAYVLHYPTLVCVFKVPAIHEIDLDGFPAGCKPVWPTLLRWISGGGWWTDDCVCVALLCLRWSGTPVPANLTTPRQLHDWLEENGYERTRFSS